MTNSPDQLKPSGKDLMTRRNFLKILGAGAASAVAASIFSKLPFFDSDKNSRENQHKAEAKTEKSALSNFIDTHPLLNNFSEEQKETVRGWVKEQIDHYNRRSFLALKDISQRARNSGAWQQLVNEKADNLGFRPTSYVRSVLPALIFVESEGEPNAVAKPMSQNAARGLCQIKLSTVLDIAQRLGIKMAGPDSLLNPDINTTLALEYIHRLNTLFPQPTLALWAYHLGEKNMARGIYAYAKEHLTSEEEQQQIDQRFEDLNMPATVYYIQTLGLNFVNMLSSKAVISQLKKDEALGDDTRYYVSRILAADYFIKGQTPAGSQTKV